MKITNRQLLAIWTVINDKYNKSNDIKVKWKITEIGKEVYEVYNRFNVEKNAIIDEFGEENEDGTKSISLTNEHLKELLECETKLSPIKLSELESLNLTFEELMVLKPIIKVEEE